MSIQITNEQYNELLLAGLKQIAHDAEQLGSGNITHRAVEYKKSVGIKSTYLPATTN